MLLRFMFANNLYKPIRAYLLKKRASYDFVKGIGPTPIW